MTDRPHLILGTAGHIDHGKSALVRALTGTDPDRLAEEKRRGITIEIGFAQLILPDGRTMGVVDVPGHERFVRQMISGATGIDVALLCIAADDGIMPQTREHLDILQLLAINSCVVAITKADLVDKDWLELVTEEIRNQLSSTKFADSPIIATSSKTGLGIEELKNALAHAVDMHVTQKKGGIMRLPVDRVFSIKGSGTVVTGTLWSGTVAQDDEVTILPSGKTARVRSIQIHDTAQDSAEAGNRVALNLSSVSVDEVRPGDFLVEPQSIRPTDRFDALYTHLDSNGRGKALKSGARVRVAHGTKEVLARLLVIDSDDDLKPPVQARVQFRLEQPLAVARNDHFVVRSYSPIRVIGGGSVLLAHPRRRTHLKKAERELFDALEKDDPSAIIATAAQTKRRFFTAQTLSDEFEVPLQHTKEVLDSLVQTKVLTCLIAEGDLKLYIQPKDLQQMLGKLESTLVAYHSEHPNEAGISKSALLRGLGIRLDEKAFDALLNKAESLDKIVNHRGIISHPEIGAGINQKEDKAAEDLYFMFKKYGIAPPLVNDIVAETGIERALAGRALSTLEEQGRIAHINKDYSFDTDAYEQLREKVREYLKEHGPSQAADLKNAMGLSRKHAIPLLEYFDAHGVTRREGDARILVE